MTTELRLEGLMQLGKLTGLQNLLIFKNEFVTDAGLSHLKNFKDPEMLLLPEGRFSKEAFAELEKHYPNALVAEF